MKAFRTSLLLAFPSFAVFAIAPSSMSAAVAALTAVSLAALGVLRLAGLGRVAVADGDCALLVGANGRPLRVLTKADNWVFLSRNRWVAMRSACPALTLAMLDIGALDTARFAPFITVGRTGPLERLLLLRDDRLVFALDRDESVAVWDSVLSECEAVRFDATRIEDVPARVALALRAGNLGHLVCLLEVPDDEIGLVTVEGLCPTLLGEGRYRLLTWGAPISVQPVDARRVGRA
jgi:hypothetical protein